MAPKLNPEKAHRALQNPELFNSEHYKQAACAVLAGIGIRLLVAIPVNGPETYLGASSG